MNEPPAIPASESDGSAPAAVSDLAGALDTLVRLIDDAGRSLDIHARQLERGLFDDAGVLEALRRFAVRPGEKQARILLQEATDLPAMHPALLGLAQRLPSAFAFREIADPGDREYPSAFVVNDRHGYYFRPLEQRLQGDTEDRNRARARGLSERFEQMWERARPCCEFRALGL